MVRDRLFADLVVLVHSALVLFLFHDFPALVFTLLGVAVLLSIWMAAPRWSRSQ